MKRLISALLALLLCLGAGAAAEGGIWSMLFGSRPRVVGKDVALADVTEFYYTYASSTFPPEYQRYRFFVEDGGFFFEHETREGERFPLTEEDATVSGRVELTEAEWARFLACVEGGTVQSREESLDSGDPGPWFYLYWNGDRGKLQQFRFASLDARGAFEALCEALREG